ncbi:hypothetical protein JCM10450v2_000363 [Rhodotorula kratochvilovae]
MSSSESEQEPALIFDGLTMLVHGPNPGRTRGQIIRAIESNGGSVTKHETNDYLTHVILSAAHWSRQGTVGADGIVRRVLAANEENRTEKDPNYHRVWLLPLDWLDDSIAKGRRLPELQYDFERTADKKRMAREQDLRRERAATKGKSKFGRGERRRWEAEQRVKQELAEQAKLEQEGTAFGGEEAFSGVVATSPVDAATSPSVAAFPPDSRQPKLNFSTPITTGTAASAVVSSSSKTEEDDSPVAGPSSSPEQAKPQVEDTVGDGEMGAAPYSDDKMPAEKEAKLAESDLATNRLAALAKLPKFKKLSASSTSSAAGKPEPSTADVKPKPKPAPNRTFIKPVANPAAKNKSSMYGNIRRPAPKALSTAAASKSNGAGAGAKDKGKARQILKLSSSDDEPIIRRTSRGGSTGASKDKKGKKRALVLSSSDDDKAPANGKANGASAPRKKGKERAEPESSDLTSLGED